MPNNQKPPSLIDRAGRKLRNYFFAGVLVAAPIGVTIYIAWSVIRYADEQVAPLIPFLPTNFPGFGLIVLLVGLTLLGAITANYFGNFFVGIGDAILRRMPIIRGLYGPIKQTAEMLFGEKTQAFRQVVMVPYPHADTWAIGFVSGETHKTIEKSAGKDLIAVLVPLSPVPTAGLLMYYPSTSIKYLDLPVEDAWKLILSSGLINAADEKAKAA